MKTSAAEMFKAVREGAVDEAAFVDWFEEMTSDAYSRGADMSNYMTAMGSAISSSAD